MATTTVTSGELSQRRVAPTGFALAWHRFKKSLGSPTPYLTVFGILLWFFTYWLLCEGLQLPRFVKIPGPVAIITEWFSANPTQGISIFTAEYYQHIAVSCRRIAIAFFLATVIGVPLGLLMGWSRAFHDYVVPDPRDAAADPDPGLGAAGDPDVQGLRDAGHIPRDAGVPLCHHAQYHARGAVDRRGVFPRRRLPRLEKVGRVQARRGAGRAAVTSSPACRSRSASPGSRWSRPRWCRATMGSAT